MSSDSPASLPVLSMVERRVLGVLVEKAKTTPDVYPMSLNSLTTGCNQKSNREPLLNLTDLEVEEVLTGLQKRGLTIKVTGGRVVRWRHQLYEQWKLDKIEIAVVAELLLRGPQTEGELRGRASRMEEIADLEALRAVLKPLVERGVVVYLTPPERRGTMLTHGFHAPDELQKLKERASSGLMEEPVQYTPAAPPPPAPSLEPALNEVKAEVAALKVQVADLAEQLRQLRQSLGA